MSDGAISHYHVDYLVWSDDRPRPVHSEHGPALCPDIVIWRHQGDVYTEVAVVHAWAPWEPPTSAENRECMSFAEWIASALNAYPECEEVRGE